METAKLFSDGRSQAVRLPKAFRFGGQTEVFIERDGDRVILTPVRRPRMQRLIEALHAFKDFPVRQQPHWADAAPHRWR